jgi:hypothetical protein
VAKDDVSEIAFVTLSSIPTLANSMLMRDLSIIGGEKGSVKRERGTLILIVSGANLKKHEQGGLNDRQMALSKQNQNQFINQIPDQAGYNIANYNGAPVFPPNSYNAPQYGQNNEIRSWDPRGPPPINYNQNQLANYRPPNPNDPGYYGGNFNPPPGIYNNNGPPQFNYQQDFPPVEVERVNEADIEEEQEEPVSFVDLLWEYYETKPEIGKPFYNSRTTKQGDKILYKSQLIVGSTQKLSGVHSIKTDSAEEVAKQMFLELHPDGQQIIERLEIIQPKKKLCQEIVDDLYFSDEEKVIKSYEFLL